MGMRHQLRFLHLGYPWDHWRRQSSVMVVSSVVVERVSIWWRQGCYQWS